MRRKFIAGITALTCALVLTASGLTLAGGDKKITLKLALPYEDATVSIDGKATTGDGINRDVEYKVPAGKKEITVSVFWEPNNYTKITRKKKVAIGDDATIKVDLTKADPKNRDDIVVRYVPTPDDVVDEMCRMAKVAKDDIVYDLGCGDGRLVIRAVKNFGAKRGVGIDIDPVRVKESKANAKAAGVEDRVEFRVGDVLKVKDMSDATVVLLYMGDDIGALLSPVLQSTLKPGSRVASHRFSLGKWEPDVKKSVDSNTGDVCDVLLWTVKAKKKQ